MTENELDSRLRLALMQASFAEYALRPGETEPELPAALVRRMRPLLADPFGRRRRRSRHALFRTAVAAVLALEAGAYFYLFGGLKNELYRALERRLRFLEHLCRA